MFISGELSRDDLSFRVRPLVRCLSGTTPAPWVVTVVTMGRGRAVTTGLVTIPASVHVCVWGGGGN